MKKKALSFIQVLIISNKVTLWINKNSGKQFEENNYSPSSKEKNF